MSKNNRLLEIDYTLTVFVGETPVEFLPELIRISENELLEIRVKIDQDNTEIKNVLLHTDMFSDHWEMLPFQYDKQGRYFFKTRVKRGGISYLRFLVETEDALLWEPNTYHRILVDPAIMDSIRMYTLIPNVTGTVADWVEQLGHIKNMGFNAVHLLPFTQMCPSESPYAASDLFKIDDSYKNGTVDFPEFAKKAGELDIIICLDIVLNHVGFTNIVCNEHGDWIVPDNKRPDGMKRAGCYHQNNWISWEDLVLINYEHPDLSTRYKIYDYMFDYVNYWIEAAGCENVMLRLDNLHSSNRHFILWLIPKIRKKYPGMIILSEFFGADYLIDEAVMDYGLNLITANSWEYPFAPDLQRYVASIHSKSEIVKYFLSPVSHDTEPAAVLFGTAVSSIPRYAVCALMGTGITGIVQGYEYGVTGKINFIGRDPEKKIQAEDDYSSFIAAVNTLVANEKCFRIKGNIEFYDTGNDSIIVCRRRDPDGGGILVAVNLDIYNGHHFEYPVIGETEVLLHERADIVHNRNDDRLRIMLDSCGVCAVRTGK